MGEVSTLCRVRRSMDTLLLVNGRYGYLNNNRKRLLGTEFNALYPYLTINQR